MLWMAVAFSGCSGDGAHANMPLEEQVTAGVEYLRVFNFEDAYKVLKHAHPQLEQDSDQWALATYSLALAAWHKSPPSHDALVEAQGYFKQVVAVEPESEWAASSLLDLGRMAEIADFIDDTEDVATAQAYYRQVLTQFPGTEMSVRATVFLAQSMAQSFDPELVREAIHLLETEMAAQPESPWMGTMAQYLAQLYAFYAHDPKAALEPYERAMEVGFPRSADSDVSLWQMGLLAEEAGEALTAARVFTRLVENYPRRTYGTVARERVIQLAQAYPDAGIEIPELHGLGIGR
ncbi:tetratricopeptide repeat protein [Coraliomargarita algicola]|uniref:Tetratricopeptide repeat protein n=1 Tax=Coraliomargarita algicola TaxID=3092156 RepID=A0ABZ0RM22_9BACT|nr:tetratricopeptide repeat protein [Coraliomargarita sp. J2-16]WPJ96466.1 tetratricopeptide repeat protein [Coraliomargarita sp. J2-16]